MDFAMHGWIAVLVVTAAFTLCAARARGLIAVRRDIYNERRDTAGHR